MSMTPLPRSLALDYDTPPKLFWPHILLIAQQIVSTTKVEAKQLRELV